MSFSEEIKYQPKNIINQDAEIVKILKSASVSKENPARIAIIVPFLDLEPSKPRTKQLNKFIRYMESFLDGESYVIFVLEQSNTNNCKFNRGQLLNYGFVIANEFSDQMPDYAFTHYIFHDVDLLPSKELKKYYLTPPQYKKPVHIAGVWDRYGSNPDYFGGIVSFDDATFLKINGYPNNFWGWGGEDDELLLRLKDVKGTMVKPDEGTLEDLEQMNITQKLEKLRVDESKFMKKREALAERKVKGNGVKSILNDPDFPSNVVGEYQLSPNSFGYAIDLTFGMPCEERPEKKSEEIIVNQEEVFNEAYVRRDDKKKGNPSEEFDKLVKLFYEMELYRVMPNKGYNELEVRFGTKELMGVKRLTKNDYDNVVKVLKSFGFNTTDPTGTPSLRIRCEFLDRTSGKFKMSDIRTEIDGIIGVEKYCKTNDIKEVFKQPGVNVRFTNKRPFMRESDKQIMWPIDMDNFNFRVSLQSEQQVTKGIENMVMENWRKSKKEFRYLNRVTFQHPDYPLRVDLSISKSGNKNKDSRGRSYIIPVYTIDESNVFNNQETYEIEIEVINREIGMGTMYPRPDNLLESLRKVIKYVLSGLQGTMFPISYPEQQDVLNDYMKMIWLDDYEPSRRITSQNFIGPNSITLQLTNISPLDENTTVANIRADFTVTDKADGDRHLMYVSKSGKIYLISTNMDVKFTGAKTLNEECFNTLFDGELISHDKNGEFINLYAAFDIYYHRNKDVRHYTFLLREDEEDVYKTRFYLLNKISEVLRPISIMDTTTKYNEKLRAKPIMDNIELSPIRFQMKRFYPMSSKESIFDGCRTILTREKEGLFEYETDGLIFTHMYYGVGSNVVGKSGPKTKITWEYSFKWKPPQFNTIDFLVTTMKKPTGEDVIKSAFEDGLSMSESVQYAEYKTVELRCGFSERNDGFLNPCQDIIDDNIPEYKPRLEDKPSNDYLPKRFYPTEPYDVNAGLCNIMLKLDGSGAKQMFTLDGEVITDNTIVEFAYDIDVAEQGWNWQPLRVRHDKTAKLRRGEREYGNSYKVCNENWKSIHPTGRITEDMLMTGLGIPDISISNDVYYNTPVGKMKTEGMKNFHNLYVKKLLISSVSKQGDTLIDLACGKAGDLPKWIAAKLSFVFGIDYSKDNLENRLDGACARYLKARMVNKHMPSALFVHGNSAFNIRDGSALLNDKAKQITKAIFGDGPKDAEKLGRGVSKQYGKADSGFNVSSCQFALHYFFETPDILREFLKNVAECTKLNGYFIATFYDGKTLFNKLKRFSRGDGVKLVDSGKQVCEIIKHYDPDTFEDDSSCIGYKISVCQESINQSIYEYLVNFDYLNRVMEAFGFALITTDEANNMGLPSGTGLFSELFINMLDELKRNKYKQTLFGEAPNMSAVEKEISFLNRYVVYKKLREVNIDKLNLELGEYEEAVLRREDRDTHHAVVVAKEEEKSLKPKIKKLTKKLLLVPATEALEGVSVTKDIEKTLKKKEKAPKKPATKAVKPLVILEDSDEEK